MPHSNTSSTPGQSSLRAVAPAVPGAWVGTMAGVPPQPYPVAGRHRHRADDPPTDVFPPVPAAADGVHRGESHGHTQSHGHGHGHTAAPPAGRRVKVLLAALLAPAALAALIGLVLLWPSGRAPTSQAAAATPVHAQVVETHA